VPRSKTSPKKFLGRLVVVVNRSKGAPNALPIGRPSGGSAGAGNSTSWIPFELFDLPHGLCAMRLLIFPTEGAGAAAQAFN